MLMLQPGMSADTGLNEVDEQHRAAAGAFIACR
jgi:hypothetical protein